jgi:hypothetical protein
VVVDNQFEAKIRKLTKPINGQYPRPWMTKMKRPDQASLFIVGYNQAKIFEKRNVGSHKRFVDAMFNRNGQDCRNLYDQVTEKSSNTRPHIDALTTLLERKGVADILETNVICYSTPMGNDIGNSIHEGGFEHGTVIFETLLDSIRPKSLIVFGSNTREKIERLFDGKLPDLPTGPDDLVIANPKRGGYSPTLYLIRSLAPPGYNKWHTWAEAHLELVTDAVAMQLKK